MSLMLRNVARPAARLPTLTAVIIACNEADRIGNCLRALSFCDAIIVVDGGSTDGTIELARGLGARVVEHKWAGFVAQKRFALSQAEGDWLLSVDADEVVDEQLAQSVRQAIGRGEHDGYALLRRNIWLGHRLRGGFAWPDRHVRLVRRECARWEGVDPHDRLVIDGSLGSLSGELVHDSYRSFADHLARIERYSGIDARPGNALDILLRPFWHVFSALIVRGGVRDGWAGVFYALMGGFYVALKWGRWRFDPQSPKSGAAE